MSVVSLSGYLHALVTFYTQVTSEPCTAASLYTCVHLQKQAVASRKWDLSARNPSQCHALYVLTAASCCVCCAVPPLMEKIRPTSLIEYHSSMHYGNLQEAARFDWFTLAWVLIEHRRDFRSGTGASINVIVVVASPSQTSRSYLETSRECYEITTIAP